MQHCRWLRYHCLRYARKTAVQYLQHRVPQLLGAVRGLPQRRHQHPQLLCAAGKYHLACGGAGRVGGGGRVQGLEQQQVCQQR